MFALAPQIWNASGNFILKNQILISGSFNLVKFNHHPIANHAIHWTTPYCCLFPPVPGFDSWKKLGPFENFASIPWSPRVIHARHVSFLWIPNGFLPFRSFTRAVPGTTAQSTTMAFRAHSEIHNGEMVFRRRRSWDGDISLIYFITFHQRIIDPNMEFSGFSATYIGIGDNWWRWIDDWLVEFGYNLYN